MKFIFIVMALLLAFPGSASAETAKTMAGKITAIVGKSYIVHANGTRVPTAVGTPVYQGDTIETSKTGAVNILFTDNTMFAVSENARLSVDKFLYDSSKNSGSSFFSMMRGVFVYTSGLIGKKDPANVHIETPVASLGIRGTAVAGHIYHTGKASQITLLDGAITITNGSGTQDMNSSFDTVSIASYQDSPKDLGEMDPKSFADSYHSLTTVAHDALDNFIDIKPGSEGETQDQGGTDRIEVPDTFDRPEIPDNTPTQIQNLQDIAPPQ